MIGGLYASVVSSDRFLIKILDNTISFKDIVYQHRNLEGLNCVFDDSLVVKTFNKKFISDLGKFISKFPTSDETEIRRYLHRHESLLKEIRIFFKMLKYSEDQKSDVNDNLKKIIRQSTKENKCDTDILYKTTLKTNFINLLELELYLRARYGAQLKNNQSFETIRPSIDLFIESLDKQFNHEYFW